ncbi:MAG: hypothetical protein CME06_00510 [Gemmatimonadetes bacterium]|nr:hypothetical protein [Gemmatimonadota bacterium]
MNPRNPLPPLILVSLVAFSTGCGDSVFGDNIEDELRDAVSRSGYQGHVVEWSSGISLPNLGIRSFGRTFDRSSVTYEVSEDDDGASVRVIRSASGVLVIDRDDDTSDNRSFVTHTSSRLVDLEGGDSDAWNVDRITVHDGQSDDLLTKIKRVFVSWADKNVMFEDTDEFYDIDVLDFFPNDEITITVVVNTQDVLGLLHLLDSDVQIMEQKVLDETEDVMVLRSSYIAPSNPGQYFTYIDVFLLSVFDNVDDFDELDDLADYSAASWGMPYKVNGNSN